MFELKFQYLQIKNLILTSDIGSYLLFLFKRKTLTFDVILVMIDALVVVSFQEIKSMVNFYNLQIVICITD